MASRGKKITKKEPQEVRCGDCGTRFKGSKKTKCPSCGSTKKANGPIHFVREATATIGLTATASVVHKARMSPESWTIFGLILGLVMPPAFYAVFYILAIALWYKILIWIGVIFIAFCLTRNYRVIKCLRFIGDKAYGKHKL